MSFAYRNTDMVKVWDLESSHDHTKGWRQKVFHQCGCSLTFDNIWYKMTGVFLWKDSLLSSWQGRENSRRLVEGLSVWWSEGWNLCQACHLMGQLVMYKPQSVHFYLGAAGSIKGEKCPWLWGDNVYSQTQSQGQRFGWPCHRLLGDWGSWEGRIPQPVPRECSEKDSWKPQTLP